MFEMAILYQYRTGRPTVIWMSLDLDRNSDEPNVPRIYFQNNYATKADKDALVPISISQEPRILDDRQPLNISEPDLNEIKAWIKVHHKILHPPYDGRRI